MFNTSTAILERFRSRHGADIDLTLRPAYGDLLAKLGNPHQHLPPVFHVAGTNGKGSTCAFLRAMLEAAGYRVHVFTSPHLIRFHECIRLAGQLITEAELAEILQECERLAIPGSVSYFEAATAAAFVAFARHAADFTILETGLGGRLDATNIVEEKLATLITRLSFDHREFLGDTIGEIAREKAGIMRPNVPCFVSAQPERMALQALRDVATTIHAPLLIAGIDWRVDEQADGFLFSFSRPLEMQPTTEEVSLALDLNSDISVIENSPHPTLPHQVWGRLSRNTELLLPAPVLLGHHQYHNAGLAISALFVLPQLVPEEAIKLGLKTVEWPARLQRLGGSAFVSLAPLGAELWLDGGHNDSAGEVLAAQIELWRTVDGAAPRPLYIILGMLITKHPDEFLAPFAQHIVQLRTVGIPNAPSGFTASALADQARKLGLTDVHPAASVDAALTEWAHMTNNPPPRILICGSLHLAGMILAAHTSSRFPCTQGRLSK